MFCLVWQVVKRCFEAKKTEQEFKLFHNLFLTKLRKKNFVVNTKRFNYCIDNEHTDAGMEAGEKKTILIYYSLIMLSTTHTRIFSAQI